MRRIFLPAVMATSLLIPCAAPPQADAFIVTCANCADIATQLWQKAQEAQAYATQLSQLQTEITSKIALVQGATALPQSIWANVSGDIMQVRNIANAGSMLTGNSGSLLTRLQNAGYYANSATNLPQNIGAQFQMYQTTMGNASNSLARVLGIQQGQEQTYAALQTRLQAQSQSAVGQMQAMQAGNELAALTSTQLNQVHTTLVAFAQEQATRDVIAADRTASEDAAMQRLTQSQPVPLNSYKGY